MHIYFKNSAFILLLCLSNLPTGIKAKENISRENVRLIPGLIESSETIKFRNKVDIIASEFENFETLDPQEQRDLLDKWDEKTIKELKIKAHFARHNMIDPPLTVSEETMKKLKEIHNRHPKRNDCVIF